MITIYLDMDGVICDFMEHYHMIEPHIDTPKKFHTMVLQHQIFEKLNWMPNGERLKAFLFNLPKDQVKIEILSSLGTHTDTVAAESKKQKEYWLTTHDVHCKYNFVNTWAHKYKYATKYSLMIDDRGDVCEDFIRAGGAAVTYVDHEYEEMVAKINHELLRLSHMMRLEKATEDLNASLYVQR